MRMLLCVRLHTTTCLSLRCRVTSGVKPIITDLYTLHDGGVVVSLEGPALFRALYAAADELGMCEDTVEYRPAQRNVDANEPEDKHLAFHKWILKGARKTATSVNALISRSRYHIITIASFYLTSAGYRHGIIFIIIQIKDV